MSMTWMSHIPELVSVTKDGFLQLRFSGRQRKIICDVISGHTGVYGEEFEKQILNVKHRFETETDYEEPIFSNEVIGFLEEAYGRDHEEVWRGYRTRL
ncbi:hypothetical protein ASPCAL06278 [Aspergillus calidoustus]|uniref:Uncharacterized protein n=1 Tax=Aspergillus calidoustus TaxID=454130 RepID=A0A0U5G0J7_ASPCI|nr:hypothetical protein ASPCAL06278 [Aspergillus calidoustus]